MLSEMFKSMERWEEFKTQVVMVYLDIQSLYTSITQFAIRHPLLRNDL